MLASMSKVLRLVNAYEHTAKAEGENINYYVVKKSSKTGKTFITVCKSDIFGATIHRAMQFCGIGKVSIGEMNTIAEQLINSGYNVVYSIDYMKEDDSNAS